MKNRIFHVTVAAVLLALGGSANAASFDYVGNYTFSDKNGNGFAETLTLKYFTFGAGLVSAPEASSTDLLGDFGEHIGNWSEGGPIELKLDENPDNWTSGVSYDFMPQDFQFGLFDDNGDTLFLANMSMIDISLNVTDATGAVNPTLKVNLFDIEAPTSYIPGSSNIVDAFLMVANEAAANFTINFGSDIGTMIEGGGGNGSYSGTAVSLPPPAVPGPVPIPAALPLLASALGLLGLIGRRKRTA